MLNITIPATELFNENTYEFVTLPEVTLTLEHSLLAISKWESKWEKPFLDKEEKTTDELYDYFRCMTVKPNVPPETYQRLTTAQIKQITDYINAPMTATTFATNRHEKPSREIITSELIYYWMTASQIPFETEKWHINRLLTLIRICGIKNGKPDKMSKKDIYAQNRALNAARRAKHGTKG
jgi:hypothetical protein